MSNFWRTPLRSLLASIKNDSNINILRTNINLLYQPWENSVWIAWWFLWTEWIILRSDPHRVFTSPTSFLIFAFWALKVAAGAAVAPWTLAVLVRSFCTLVNARLFLKLQLKTFTILRHITAALIILLSFIAEPTALCSKTCKSYYFEFS